MTEKKPHKGIWGVRIEPSIRWFDWVNRKNKYEPTDNMHKASEIAERPDIPSNLSIDLYFDLKIGQFRKGDNKWSDQFVTNPVVQQIIQNSHLKTGTSLGRMNIAIFPASKELMTFGFQPFKENAVLKGIGIASFAELRIEKILEKLFSGYNISTTMGPSHNRITQMKKRGRKAAKYIPIQEAVRLTSEYVRKGMKEYNQRMALMKRRKRKWLLAKRNAELKRKGIKARARFLSREKNRRRI